MTGERTVHIVGAGLSGLAAALSLSGAGRKVVVHEAAPQAGGRCRSYDDMVIYRRIDNGNHLIVSANPHALTYLDEVGARAEMLEVTPAHYDFVDLRSGDRWTLDIPTPFRPWSWFGGMPPGTGRWGLLKDIARLLRAGPDDSLDSVLGSSTAWETLWRPLGVSALNTEAETASAVLFAATVRATILKGERASRPLVAKRGLGEAFVDPALRVLADRAAEVRFGSRVRALTDDTDWVVATAPAAARELLPDDVPELEARPILNAHFRVRSTAEDVVFRAMVGGLSEWVFHRDDVVSITISAAQRFLGVPADEMLSRLWREARVALDLEDDVPLAQRLLVEKRATFAQTPAQLGRRPGPGTSRAHVVLAGDYTDTGLPATIEGSIASGRRAAERLLGQI
ncbi:MAG: hydroxysqualene dehydroxylase HpnE [Alphaproteobacteria bacterium]|nr:hydroxysqualene dehydroxylase HpnE [Alphaproteobacteria bacterium]